MPGLRVLMFDLDGTLYDCQALLDKQREVAIDIIKDHINCDWNQAKQKLDDTQNQMQQSLGYFPSMTAATVEIGIPLKEYVKSCADRYDGSDFLERDQQLINTLMKLNQHYNLGLVSNNNSTQIGRMLSKLGIENFFQLQLGVDTTYYIKPDVRVYEHAMNKLGVLPEECMVIGDRQDIDLKPAKDLGMITMLVSSVKDVYNLGAILEPI